METNTLHPHDETEGVKVLVLTSNQEFGGLVSVAISERHPVFYAQDLDEALSEASELQPGVLVADAESLGKQVDQTLAQFRQRAPHMVPVIARQRGSDTGLMRLMSTGQVYRVIVQPAGTGQTELCIERAAHHHLELEHQPQETDDGQSAAEPWRFILPAGTALMLGLGIALWATTAQWFGVGGPDAEHAAMASGMPAQLGIEELLDEAEAAMAVGHYFAPARKSAAHYYREVLTMAPDHSKALLGLRQVSDQMATGAEKAFSEDRPIHAQALIAAAKRLQLENPHLASIERQIQKEQQLMVLKEAQAAAETGELNRAMNILGGVNNNPIGSSALAITTAFVDVLLDGAETAIAGGKIPEAREMLSQIQRVVPEHPRLAKIERQLADAAEVRAAETLAAREKVVAEVRERTESLIQKAGESIEVGRLVTPADHSALAYLQEAQRISPDDPTVQASLATLQMRFLERAQQQLETGNFDAAEQWLARADSLEAEDDSIDVAWQQLELARINAESSRVIPATDLEWTNYVEPEYPSLAWRREIEGWVDVEFTVTKNGQTRDIQVIDARRDGYFKEPAVEAVRQWRFEPRVFRGQTVDQRVRLRVSFTREEPIQ